MSQRRVRKVMVGVVARSVEGRRLEAWGVVLGHLEAQGRAGGGWVTLAEVERVMHGVQRAAGEGQRGLVARSCCVRRLEAWQAEGLVETRVVVRRVQGRGMTVKGPVRVWRAVVAKDGVKEGVKAGNGEVVREGGGA